MTSGQQHAVEVPWIIGCAVWHSFIWSWFGLRLPEIRLRSRLRLHVLLKKPRPVITSVRVGATETWAALQVFTSILS